MSLKSWCVFMSHTHQPALKTYLSIPVIVTAVTYWFSDSKAAFRHRRARGRICCIIHAADWYSTHQSGPVLFAKDTRGAAAAKCHSLKFTVILSGIQCTATSQPCDSEPWNQPCRCGTVHIKAALLMDDPQHPQPPTTSCNYVALLKCPC